MRSKRIAPFLMILFLSLPTFSKNKNYGPLEYSKIASMIPDLQRQYIDSFKDLLKAKGVPRTDDLIADFKNNDTCRKKKMKTCFFGIYGKGKCVSPRANARKECHSHSAAPEELYRYFYQHELYQQTWIDFSAQFSELCENKNQKNFCEKLNKLNRNIMKKYQPTKDLTQGIL